jgi:hypothetical protein
MVKVNGEWSVVVNFISRLRLTILVITSHLPALPLAPFFQLSPTFSENGSYGTPVVADGSNLPDISALVPGQ